MYSRKVKAVFGFMVFLMGVGYLVLILNSFPAFSNLIGGTGSSSSATQRLVDKAQKTIDKQNCRAGMPAGPARTKCKRALEDMGAGYQTLSQPSATATELPKDAERNLNKSVEAFKLLVAVDPKDKDSKQFLANAYSSIGKSAQAMPLYQELSKQDPSNDLYLYAYARSAEQAGKKEEALKAYKQYVKLFPEETNTETAQEAIKNIENPQSAAGTAAALGG
ncbi:MAG: tetratricopeptide repeat protein [Thermoleophilia bacterium]|nr:tetratricopeptide repeat protein [Thermoleophilia bacterium]